MTPDAIINVLPIVSNQTQVYFTVILSDNSLNQATITSAVVLYGNVSIVTPSIFIAIDDKPIGILYTATYSGITYVDILYTKAISQDVTPNNFNRIIQKIPYGVFLGGTSSNTLVEVSPNQFIMQPSSDNTIVGNDMMARALMTDNYYKEYFKVAQEVYSSSYTTQLEYEYNGTIGLLSTSAYPNQLFALLATLPTYFLNTYDLELFVSQYIYFRLGTISAVYIDDHISSPTGYWILGIAGSTELGSTTILAPDNYTPVIQNLDWLIFNSSAFTTEFKQEIIDLIIRISRADLGNSVAFTPIINPVEDGFTLIGPTYPLDPRLIFDKCIQYIGPEAYPLNIIGYQNIFSLFGELLVYEGGETYYLLGIDPDNPDAVLLINTSY